MATDISALPDTNMEPWRYTVHDYRQMYEMGLFGNEARVELIDGEVFKVSPQGPSHIMVTSRAHKILNLQCGDNAIVIGQSSIELDEFSELEPDIAVLRGGDHQYDQSLARPDDILLAVEVAVTSLNFDRTKKLPRYAQNGVPEVWIVDCKRRVVEKYCQPASGEYQQCTYIALGEAIQASQFPAINFTSDRLFSDRSKTK